jgi:membrane protein
MAQLSTTGLRRAASFLRVRGPWAVAKRAVIGFYDDQCTHHAAALTYYALMSLFPVLLLAVSLLGLIGEYPATYDSIVGYLGDVVPATTLAPLDDAVRAAFKSTGTASAALAVGAATALYGGTGYLEAARRALNVVFEADGGRSFLRRKLTDAASLVVLMALVITTLVLMFAGAGLARDLLGNDFGDVWEIGRWPAAVVSALLVFSFVYYVTPDVRPRSFRSIVPGAAVAVVLWVAASVGFSEYLRSVPNMNVTYGSFAAAIILLFWLWLTNVALLFGGEVNAEIERGKELAEGVPESDTLDLQARGRTGPPAP